MSGNVRVRRPPSPPTTAKHSAPHHTPRFPHPRDAHLDADARRAAASLAGPSVASSVTRVTFGGFELLTRGDHAVLAVLAVLATLIRFFRISWPDSVVFDEVHFGKFASRYIKGEYFVDVHPPLAKLLITLVGWLGGYDGTFDFKDIGKPYESVPYVPMRLLPALFSALLPLLAYITIRLLHLRATSALLAALLIIFDNALTTQSRLILLDSPLVFMTALTATAWVAFCNENARADGAGDKSRASLSTRAPSASRPHSGPFSRPWYTLLLLTGVSLGLVVSCKWVGLFTIATVGFGTIRQLWLLLGDTRVNLRVFGRHFIARAIALIVVPVAVYMFIFQIHFLLLPNSGEGDGFMSSEFQHTLRGRWMGDTFADNALGSEVSIRHLNTQGGYLHSHAHNYPGGSHQQQITLYPHKDENNAWRIVNATEDDHATSEWLTQPLQYIKHGSRVKLMHLQTSKHLHSHEVRPPVSDVDFQNEVSGYGFPGFAGDVNDHWIVEIDREETARRGDRWAKERVRTLRTLFRLRHEYSGCYLFSHKVKLPEWGFEQQEVTCNKNAVRKNSLWFVETSKHPLLPPDSEKVNYKLPGFLSKFSELQQVMWTTNAGLTDRHTYDSRPWSWPLLKRGINFWVKDHRQIYLLGNPLVWWLSSLSVLAYVAVRGFLILRAQRGYKDFANSKIMKYDSTCGFLFMGWALHYLPFFLMARQLFLHHYLPALYFAVLLAAAVFDFLTTALKSRVRLQIAAVLVVGVVWTFLVFSPLTYGSTWTKAQCNKARWLKTWDLSCNDFYEDYSQYKAIPATPQKSNVPVATIGGEQNGRRPIVVQDQFAHVVNPDPAVHAQEYNGQDNHRPGDNAASSSVTLSLGQAAPGPDVFAKEPAEQIINSETMVNSPPAKEEEVKEVSTVTVETVAPLTVDAALSAAADSVDLSDTSVLAENTLASIVETTIIASVIPHQEQHAPPAEQEPEQVIEKVEEPAGPLSEDEAEADRVAADLFPEVPQK